MEGIMKTLRYQIKSTAENIFTALIFGLAFSFTLTFIFTIFTPMTPFHDGGVIEAILFIIASTMIVVFGGSIFVSPFLVYYMDFSKTVRYGNTRKNFVISNLVHTILLILIVSALISLLILGIRVLKSSNMGTVIISTENMGPMEIFMNKVNFFVLFIAFFQKSMFYSSICSILAILQYRFGPKIWVGGFLLNTITSYYGAMENNFIEKIKAMMPEFLWVMLFFILVHAIVSYFTLKLDPEK